MLTLSDLLELGGVALIFTAAGLWDLRALMAVAGVVAVLAGYLLGVDDGEVIG
jgi:hypothetical protein